MELDAQVPAAEAAGGREGREGPVRRVLSENPSLPLLTIATASFIWLSADEGGYFGTSFLPGTLILLALLVVGLISLPTPRLTRARAIAIALLAAYALWSYLSIAWADQPDLAWTGANRTAMYALVLALFTLWPLRGRVAVGLVSLYVLGVAGVGLVELFRAAASNDPVAYLNEGRLSEPTGYANANVALWTTAFWPALLIAGRRGVPWALRGVLLGSAGLLAALAILGQSRGWLVVMPVVFLLAVAIVPGRGRTIGAMALVGAAIALTITPLLNVYRDFDAARTGPQGVPGALTATLIATGLLIVVGAAWALADHAPWFDATRRRRLGVALVVALAVCCVGSVAAYSVARGSPISRVEEEWQEFRLKSGESELHSGESARLGTLGGSWRYDYWRVAWELFEEHPLIGVGGDNFGRQYLIRGESGQTPTFPHSVELRALEQTGLIGTAMLVGSIVAALIAAGGRIRRDGAAAALAAATGTIAFAYFILHGSMDWLWEFPALGAAAFAMLGIAAVVSDREARRTASARTEARRPRAPTGRAWRWAAIGSGAIGAVALVASLTLPWLAERDLHAGEALAATDPTAAVKQLERASDLNPLSPLPEKTAAAIELRNGDIEDAERRFLKAQEEDPGDPFVHLELATIASTAGRQAEAVRQIRWAAELNPLDGVTRRVQKLLESGRKVTPEQVDRLILRNINARIGPQ